MIKLQTKRLFCLVLFAMCSIVISQAQDGLELEDDFITNVFNYGTLINTQTTEVVEKGSFELRIQHRFGEMDVTNFKNTVIDEWLGFDGSANIRFGFAFAPFREFQIGIGRTKIDKAFDLEAKYRVLRQKEKGSPVSATLYFNTVMSTREFPEVGPNEFFSDEVTPFEYKFSHRFSYNTQVLLSIKMGEIVSLELNPSLLYKNLVPPGRDNFIGAAAFGGRFKTGFTSSILLEFTAKFNDRTAGYKDPISLGFEIGTAGHSFQMFVTTTNQITDQQIFFNQPSNYTEGKILLGFNLKRTFWNGNN